MPLIELRGISKAYGGLRPLRLAELAVMAGETVVVEGLDETAASVLVDLVTGTTLPDDGDVTVGGVLTSSIADHEAWLGSLEQFGIVNARVVLLDELTILQNLAVPLTLDLDPIAPVARHRVLELAKAVGLVNETLESRLVTGSPLVRFRVRLGRAIAHSPRILLVEHPMLGLAPADAKACAEALRRASGPERAMLVLSND